MPTSPFTPGQSVSGNDPGGIAGVALRGGGTLGSDCIPRGAWRSHDSEPLGAWGSVFDEQLGAISGVVRCARSMPCGHFGSRVVGAAWPRVGYARCDAATAGCGDG